MNKVEANVQEFIKKYSLQDKTILVAFSGGFDSMCLLEVLINLGLNPIAIHLNHNWRGEESAQEEENCRQFCLKKGVEFYSEILDKGVPATETAAREARYDFFERCAEEFSAKAVLTAHNADDNAETVLYRITKGTGLEGLKGIAPVRDIYYRPLLTTYRADIEKYCQEKNLTPNNDSSNQNTKYKRNQIRHKVLTELEKINKDIKIALNNLSEVANADTEIINEYLESLENKFVTQNFIGFSHPIQNRIIYNFLTENNLEYDKRTVEKIVKFINENSTSKNGKTLSITTDKFLFVNSHEIRLISEEPQGNFRLKIEECSQKPEKFPPDSEFKAYVDLTDVGTDFELRHRKDGDVIRPLGTNGTQKLKKYLSEKAIPKDQRDKMLFLCQNNEVLWATGVGISERIKVKDKPTHIIKLERI